MMKSLTNKTPGSSGEKHCGSPTPMWARASYLALVEHYFTILSFFCSVFLAFFFLMFFVSLHPTPHHTFKSGNSMDRRTSFEKFAQNVVSFNFLRNYKSLSPVKISLFLAPLPTLHSLTPKVLSLFKPIILLPPYLSPQPFIE